MAELNIRERLPQRLREEPYTVGVSGPMTELSQEVLAAAYSMADQFSVVTATDWGLREWERLTGLQTDPGLSLEERRRAVIAKLCSTGTTNAEMVRALAEALTGYGADVSENFSDYSFSLRFFGEEAGFIQIDAELLNRTVEEIKPAHLRFIIEPIRWEDLEAAALTWAGLEAQFGSWNALESAFYCHKKEAGP